MASWRKTQAAAVRAKSIAAERKTRRVLRVKDSTTNTIVAGAMLRNYSRQQRRFPGFSSPFRPRMKVMRTFPDGGENIGQQALDNLIIVHATAQGRVKDRRGQAVQGFQG